MPERDITEKHLEAYDDVFADIVNVLLFDGQRLSSLSSISSRRIDLIRMNSTRTGDRPWTLMQALSISS